MLCFVTLKRLLASETSSLSLPQWPSWTHRRYLVSELDYWEKGYKPENAYLHTRCCYLLLETNLRQQPNHEEDDDDDERTMAGAEAQSVVGFT